MSEGKIPSFVPINYDRKKIQIVEQKEEKPINTPNVPESTTPDIPDIPKEKESIKIEPCPGSKDQRVGDFRNEKRLDVSSGMKEVMMGLSVSLYMKTFLLWINTSQNQALLFLLLLLALWLRVALLFSI